MSAAAPWSRSLNSSSTERLPRASDRERTVIGSSSARLPWRGAVAEPLLALCAACGRAGAVVVEDHEFAAGRDHNLFLVALAFLGPLVAATLRLSRPDDAGRLLALALGRRRLPRTKATSPAGSRVDAPDLRDECGLLPLELFLGKPADRLLHGLRLSSRGGFMGRSVRRRHGMEPNAGVHHRLFAESACAAGTASNCRLGGHPAMPGPSGRPTAALQRVAAAPPGLSVAAGARQWLEHSAAVGGAR